MRPKRYAWTLLKDSAYTRFWDFSCLIFLVTILMLLTSHKIVTNGLQGDFTYSLITFSSVHSFVRRVLSCFRPTAWYGVAQISSNVYRLLSRVTPSEAYLAVLVIKPSSINSMIAVSTVVLDLIPHFFAM